MGRLSEAIWQLADELEDARAALDGDSNDAEHDALYGLTEAARNVVDSWTAPECDGYE